MSNADTKTIVRRFIEEIGKSGNVSNCREFIAAA